MSAIVLDGKALAASQEQDLAKRVLAIKQSANGRVPILATVLVTVVYSFVVWRDAPDRA